MLKKVLALLLCVAMIATMLVACGAKEEVAPVATEAAPAASENNNVDSDKPFAGTELHIVTVRDTRDTSTDETYGEKTALKMAEEATGIKIKWTVLDDATVADKLPALLASEDQPDLYLRVLDQVTIADNKELFYDLSEEGLLETYAPNVLAAYEPYNYLENLTWSDGSIYSLHVTEMATIKSSWSFSNLVVRKDWLEQLNLPVPTTAEELYNTLVAFKNNDMNGNGDTTDEIPLSFASDYWQGELWLHSNAFGLHGSTWQNFMHYKMLDENGDVVASCKQDDFRKFLEFYHKLYSEGLVDVEGFSQTGEQYEAKIANNQVGVYTRHTWDPTNEISFLYEGYDGVKLVRDGFQNRGPSDVYRFGFVATADANIEALLTWWNYLSQKDVALIAAYGDPAKNDVWEYNENGDRQLKAVETTVDGKTTYTNKVFEDWMFADIMNGYPAIAPDWTVDNPIVVPQEGSRQAVAVSEEYLALLPPKEFSRRIVSDEMIEARTDIELELFDYIESFVAESVVYGLDDAKWQKHIDQLTALGYDEWIQWYQDVEDGNVY